MGPPSGESRPVPDPTRLTTAALEREVAALRELIISRLEQHEKLEAELHRRLEGRIGYHESSVSAQFAELTKEHEFKRLSQKETFDETKVSLARRVDDAKLTADVQLNALRDRVSVMEQWRAVHQEQRAHAGAIKDIEVLEERLKPLENFRGQAALIAAGVATVSGLIGAAIARLLFAP